jgi:hypothetical protein
MTITSANIVELSAEERRNIEKAAAALGYRSVSDFIRHSLGLATRARRAEVDADLETLCGL